MPFGPLESLKFRHIKGWLRPISEYILIIFQLIKTFEIHFGQGLSQELSPVSLRSSPDTLQIDL